MRILISGIGVAGPTLAYWLKRHGFEPVLVEKAPKLRTHGYLIDFWGAGYEIAERMGLLPEITRRGYRAKEVRVVNRHGKQVSGFDTGAFERITDGKFVSLERGVLSELIHGALSNRVETIFGDTITAIREDCKGVEVTFEHAPARTFDLVIGADGLHSRVRDLVFGSSERFEKYLGYQVAAFEATGYERRDELAYLMFTEVGQQVGRFSLRGNRTLFLFIYANESPELPREAGAQKALLRHRFGASGWECPKILDAMDSCSELYFDRVSQIRMERDEGLWSKGRVSLVGDAASCVSLLAGQGTALAMTAAYILAGELKRSQGDYREAFKRYEALFGPFVARKQKAAVGFAGAFAPRSGLGLYLRNQVFKLMAIPWIAEFAAGRDLADRLELPEY